MSAWIVSHGHIDILVKAIVEGPAEAHNWPGVTLHWDARRSLPNDLGQELLDECIRSVAFRYTDTDADDLPGTYRPEGTPEYRIPYDYDDPGFRPTAGEIFKAVNCYAYQSCEHDEWQGSAAWRVCDDLKGYLADSLHPDSGPHGWDREQIAFRRVAGRPIVDWWQFEQLRGAVFQRGVAHAGSQS